VGKREAVGREGGSQLLRLSIDSVAGRIRRVSVEPVSKV
jgi:hypothetical protein